MYCCVVALAVVLIVVLDRCFPSCFCVAIVVDCRFRCLSFRLLSLSARGVYHFEFISSPREFISSHVYQLVCLSVRRNMMRYIRRRNSFLVDSLHNYKST